MRMRGLVCAFNVCRVVFFRVEAHEINFISLLHEILVFVALAGGEGSDKPFQM